MDNRLLNSLSINERCFLQKKDGRVKGSITSLNRWLERKSLLDNEDFKSLVKSTYNSLDDFTLGISPIPNSDFAFDYIKKQEWFILCEEILESYDCKEDRLLQTDISFPFRFFLQYTRKKLISINSTYGILSENAIIDLLNDLLGELIHLSSKCLVEDLHYFKDKFKLSGDTGSERFNNYLSCRFKSIKTSKDFWYTYPELLRLLTIRTKFFIENTLDMICNINKEYSNIKKFLNIDSLIVEGLSSSQGDSHNKGKSVTIITFNDEKRLVYKTKNEVKQVDILLEFLNENFETELFIPQKLIGDGYVFEEFIENNEARNLQEIKRYYKRYGIIIALAYVLNITDLHYENIIANGEFPVIIDTETLFQHHIPINFGKSATVDAKYRILDSIMVSGLIPNESFKDKSSSGKGINLSGLNYEEQVAPFKVLKPSKEMTDEMRFEFQNHTIRTSKNIPKLAGKNVCFLGYEDDIIMGMKTCLKNIQNNKEKLLNFLDENMTELIVRNVIRATQRYSDMLEFSFHPSCFITKIEREKVLHNIWAFPYKQKDVIRYEFSDLMDGDIPQFFNKISDRDLITSNGEKIKNFYEVSALEKVKRKIIELTDATIDFQVLFLKLSLKEYNYHEYIDNYDVEEIPENNEKIKRESILDVAREISNTIRNRAIINNETQTVNWLDIRLKNSWQIDVLDNNLYDGLPGIYLFYVALKFVDVKGGYDSFMKIIRNTMYTIPTRNNISAFFGKFSLVYPLIVDFQLNNDNQSLCIAEEIVESLIDIPLDQTEIKNDWILGANSLIVVCNLLYKITKNKKYNNFAKDIFQKIPSEAFLKIEEGFGHGINSYLYTTMILEKKIILVNP